MEKLLSRVRVAFIYIFQYEFVWRWCLDFVLVFVCRFLLFSETGAFCVLQVFPKSHHHNNNNSGRGLFSSYALPLVTQIAIKYYRPRPLYETPPPQPTLLTSGASCACALYFV